MSLGKKLIRKLKPGVEGEVEVEEDGVRAKADVVGSGPYGAEVKGISVGRVDPRGESHRVRGDRMRRVLDDLPETLDYLPERLAPLEADPASGKGVLRTPRTDVRGREYYEVTVDGGDKVDVERYRGRDEAAGRDSVSQNYGHSIVERLVDDLGEIVGDSRDSVRSGDDEQD